MTTNDKPKQTRNRRTRQERIADALALAAKLQAQLDGNYDETNDDAYIVKQHKRAIRRRETALKTAHVLLNGRAATDKSPAVAGIDAKIANAEQRIANLRAAKVRALEVEARLPFDIEVLRASLSGAEKGEVLEMPTGLYVLADEKDRTEAEIEAGSVVDGGRGTDETN